LIILLFTSGVHLSFSQSNKDYVNGFEKRRNFLLNYLAKKPEVKSIFTAYAKLYFDKDKEKVIKYIDELTSKPRWSMFLCHHLIDFYLRFKDELPVLTREKIRNYYVTNYWMRGDTENHWNLYYSGLYLAAEEWPDENRWFNGKSSRKIKEESLEWFNRWMETTVTIGQGEYDSPNYTGVHIGALLSLYDLAKSPEVRLKAKMMLDYILADYAVDYLKGMYTGGHSRETYYQVTYTKNHNGTTTPVGFLYFGEADINPDISQLGFSIIAAISSYRLPFIIYKIATDRGEPYENIEVHRTRERFRYCGSPFERIYKYSYMTKDYCLCSTQGNTSTVETEIHSWDLSYVSSEPHSTIFFMHPYYSYKDLSRFFPELPRLLLPQINRVRPYMTGADRWNGGSPYEQMIQYKNAIIVIYNIPDDDHFPLINGFFPESLDEKIDDRSGWVFCREKNIYIAVKPIKPYFWEEGEYFYRFRSFYRKNGIIMEVDTQDNYHSFDDFKNQIRSNYLNYKNFDTKMRVEYRSSSGNLLSITYNGGHYLNKKRINYECWDTFNSPYLKCKKGSKILEIKYKNIKEILDFNKFKITEK